jgi:hypothetical protein
MPGPVSQSSKGPSDDSPYVPTWAYKNGPRMCPCGHHEGYHGDDGHCSQARTCRCSGLPPECYTPIELMD